MSARHLTATLSCPDVSACEGTSGPHRLWAGEAVALLRLRRYATQVLGCSAGQLAFREVKIPGITRW